jgi:hypothetical protein
MRTITEHKVNAANDQLTIHVLDEPGAGGANHHYMVTLPDWTRAPDGSEAKGFGTSISRTALLVKSG